MKAYSLLLTILILTKSGWTQNSNLNYKYALKVYNLTSFEEHNKSISPNDTSSYRSQYASTSLQILHPTIAFQLRTSNNNFQEIELTTLRLERNVSKTEILNDTTNYARTLNGSKLTTTTISIRYEYILNFNKSKDAKLVPSLGFGINPYYRHNNYSPLISSSFPASEKHFGIRGFLSPRLTYYLTSKLFIDINIPICFFDANFHIENEKNPTISIPEQKNSSFNYTQFPKIFSGRIGVGLKL